MSLERNTAVRGGCNPPLTAGWAVAALATIACATGLAQAGVLAWRLHVNHRIIFQSRDFVWMAPAGYLLVLGAIAPALLAAGLLADRITRRHMGRRLFAGTISFTGGFALVVLVPGLHPAAETLLALGLAANASRWLARASQATLGRVALVLIGASCILGVTERFTTDPAGRSEVVSGPALQSSSPNVLLIVMDTVRAANLSLYGYRRPTTPALVRWASEGVTFSSAFSPAPWTFPSHAAIFTGKLPSRLQPTWDRSLDRSAATIAEALRDRGYDTAGFVANTYYVGYDSGLARGFVHYADYQTSLEQTLRSTTLLQMDSARWFFDFDPRSLDDARAWLWEWGRAFNFQLPPLWAPDPKPAALVTDQFLDWQAQSTGRPFFAFLNYMDGHEPARPPPPYRTLFAAHPDDLDLYDGSIRYLDDQIERLLSTLRERGLLDRTVVILTSDHGQQFGEHGLYLHGNSLYSQLLWVPLVIRYPARIPAETRITSAVALTELPATLMDLTGYGSHGFSGKSLARFWQGTTIPDDEAPVISELVASDAGYQAARGPLVRSIVAGDLHWFRLFDGSERLYDYRRDADETRDLLDSKGLAAQLAVIRAHAAGLGAP